MNTKEWLDVIEHNKRVRESKVTCTIMYGSNKMKEARIVLNKNKKLVIRSLKRKFGRKLTPEEIKDVKSALMGSQNELGRKV